MTTKNLRRPWHNFFIRRSFQLGIAFKILLIVVLTAAVSTLALAAAYNAKARNGNFYYMSRDVRRDIELKSMWGIVFPGVVACQVVSIVVGAGLGLFFSRKIAVPLYKLDKWINLLRRGNLRAQVHFREGGPFKDLSIACNETAEYYRGTFVRLAEIIDEIDSPTRNPAAARRLVDEARTVLASLEIRPTDAAGSRLGTEPASRHPLPEELPGTAEDPS